MCTKSIMIVRNLVLFKGKDMSIEGVIVVEVSQCDAHELTGGWKKLLLQDSEMIQGTQRVLLKISWYQYFSHLINQHNMELWYSFQCGILLCGVVLKRWLPMGKCLSVVVVVTFIYIYIFFKHVTKVA